MREASPPRACAQAAEEDEDQAGHHAPPYNDVVVTLDLYLAGSPPMAMKLQSRDAPRPRCPCLL